MADAGSRDDAIREPPNRFNLPPQRRERGSVLRRTAKSRGRAMAPNPKRNDLKV
jgi:hypothetical protein